MTLYLVRHAQSLPRKSTPFAEWPLSPVGARQADELAAMLEPLRIAQVFSSPFLRTLQTAKPFADRRRLPVVVVDDLRERHITNEGGLPSDEVWRKSWEDFNFAPPGCETSSAAKTRICRAIRQLARSASGTTALFTHGNVIGLFLGALTGTTGRKEAETLTNPDVLRLTWKNDALTWDSAFQLPGLEAIATNHSQTPREPEPASLSNSRLTL